MTDSPPPIRAQTAPMNNSPNSSARSKLKTSQTSRSGLSSRQSQRRPMTQQERVKRARQRGRDQAQRRWFERYKNIPGEHQFADYNDQEGMGVSKVTFSWLKEMRAVHCKLIRHAKSYVVEDVEEHEVLADKLAILFDTTEARARERLLHERKLQRENLHMLKNISNLQFEKTEISETLDPTWRKKQLKHALDHTKHLRVARQLELDVVNKHNQELLHFLQKAEPYYSNKNQREHWRRHVRLREAMRKVMPKKKKKKKKRISDYEWTLGNRTPRLLPAVVKERRQKTKVQTRGEVMLKEMYHRGINQAGSSGVPAGEFVSRVSTPNTKQRRVGGGYAPPITPMRAMTKETKTPVEKKLDTALGMLGLSNNDNDDYNNDNNDNNNGSPLFLPTPIQQNNPLEENLLKGTYDAGDEHSLLMAPKEITLAGKKNIVSVYRVVSEVNNGVKYKLEDVQQPGNIRAVYVSTDDIRRICNQNKVLLRTESSKGNRFERIALLLDLESAFDGKI